MKPLLSLVLAVGLTAVSFADDEIACEGTYHGHLQGVATDGTSIYWSFTCEVVKTDRTGKLLASSGPVPSHQGDLCVKDGIVYVAVNLGKFNSENDGKSEVHSYDAATMKLLKKWKLPEMGHGAGGMTCVGDRFLVIGGLPATHECNYVYEYDKDFMFVRRHDLATGFTLMGIQTAAYEDGKLLFGIYGGRGNPRGVLECTPDLKTWRRHEGPGGVGILTLDGKLYAARTGGKKEARQFYGKLLPAPDMCADSTLWKPAKKGGELRIYHEGLTPKGWKDCGYKLIPNGYKPLTTYAGAFSPVKKPAAVLGAVGIGGDRSYSAPDLVRGVRRAAECDEILCLHVPGVPDGDAKDSKLAEALKAVVAEAEALGVKVLRF